VLKTQICVTRPQCVKIQVLGCHFIKAGDFQDTSVSILLNVQDCWMNDIRGCTKDRSQSKYMGTRYLPFCFLFYVLRRPSHKNLYQYSCRWFALQWCASTNTENIFVNSVKTCMPLHKYRFSFLENIFCLFHIKSCKQTGFFHSNVSYFITEKYHEGFMCKLTLVTAKSSYDRIRIIIL